MPYDIRKRGSLYVIVRRADGKTVGRSASRKKAAASIRMRMRGESK